MYKDELIPSLVSRWRSGAAAEENVDGAGWEPDPDSHLARSLRTNNHISPQGAAFVFNLISARLHRNSKFHVGPHISCPFTRFVCTAVEVAIV